MIFSTRQNDWKEFFVADILQCIGLTLLFLVILVLVFQETRARFNCCGLFGIFSIFPCTVYFIGSVVGHLYDKYNGKSLFVIVIVLSGVLLFWIAWNSHSLAHNWFDMNGWKNFYLSSPSWCLGKLFLVLPSMGIWWAWGKMGYTKEDSTSCVWLSPWVWTQREGSHWGETVMG